MKPLVFHMIPFLGSLASSLAQELSGGLLCEAVLHAARIPAGPNPGPSVGSSLKPKRCAFTARTANRVEVVSHAHDGLLLQRRQCGVPDEQYESEWNITSDASLAQGAGKSGSLFLSSKSRRMTLKTISEVEMESFYDPFIPRLHRPT